MTRDINIGDIRPDPDQPRTEFDEAKISELARSLKENGLAVPIAVRPVEDGYMIISGERRWRAARKIGWDTIPVDIHDVGPEKARWLSLIENIQREDLSPIEEARAYVRQIEQHDLTQGELADRIGKSQSYVAHKLRLLDLPPPISFWLESGALSESHVRMLSRLKRFYLEGATIGYKEDISTDVEPFDAIGILSRQAPVDWPLVGPLQNEDEKGEIVQSSVARFFSYVADQGYVADAWEVAGWYFGGLAYCKEMSVSKLAKELDCFERLVRGHYTYFLKRSPTWDPPNAPMVTYESEEEESSAGQDVTHVSELTREEAERELARLHYWGVEADLHHAGLLGTLRRTLMARSQAGSGKRSDELDLREEQIEANWALFEESPAHVEENGGRLPPTMLAHPAAPEARDGMKLRSRLRELEPATASEEGL